MGCRAKPLSKGCSASPPARGARRGASASRCSYAAAWIVGCPIADGAALLIVPGVILLRALRVPGEAVATHPIYVPAASILVLLFSGLAIDLIGPPVGLAAPLQAAPLLIALEVVCFGLLACSVSAPPETEIPWSSLSQPARMALAAAHSPAVSGGCAAVEQRPQRAVADLAVVVVMIATIAGFVFAPRYDDSLLMVGIFALGLAMMWSFSLRGDVVYGFDISNEYYALEQTVTSGVWHVSHPNDAYGAMLSLTVLPAELHALSGIPALLILKVVYPVIGALFPVGVFSLARRILTGRWAFMAAALVLMQQTFFQQMPALARQEVATLLFAVLLLVVLDATQSRGTKWTFVCLLSLGMVVSHYSTAYLAITLLGIAIVFQLRHPGSGGCRALRGQRCWPASFPSQGRLYGTAPSPIRRRTCHSSFRRLRGKASTCCRIRAATCCRPISKGSRTSNDPRPVREVHQRLLSSRTIHSSRHCPMRAIHSTRSSLPPTKALRSRRKLAHRH